MATIAKVITRISTFNDPAHIVTWTPLTFAGLDAGEAMEMPGSSERSIQVFGTLGVGGSLAVQGSNDGTNWAVLNDPQGVALNIAALGIHKIQELPRYLRPVITAGDGTTSLSAVLLAKLTK